MYKFHLQHTHTHTHTHTQCIAAGSHIANHEVESTELRPYAIQVSKMVTKVRQALREECFTNKTGIYPQKVHIYSTHMYATVYSLDLQCAAILSNKAIDLRIVCGQAFINVNSPALPQPHEYHD